MSSESSDSSHLNVCRQSPKPKLGDVSNQVLSLKNGLDFPPEWKLYCLNVTELHKKLVEIQMNLSCEGQRSDITRRESLRALIKVFFTDLASDILKTSQFYCFMEKELFARFSCVEQSVSLLEQTAIAADSTRDSQRRGIATELLSGCRRLASDLIQVKEFARSAVSTISCLLQIHDKATGLNTETKFMARHVCELPLAKRAEMKRMIARCEDLGRRIQVHTSSPPASPQTTAASSSPPPSPPPLPAAAPPSSSSCALPLPLPTPPPRSSSPTTAKSTRAGDPSSLSSSWASAFARLSPRPSHPKAPSPPLSLHAQLAAQLAAEEAPIFGSCISNTGTAARSNTSSTSTTANDCTLAAPFMPSGVPPAARLQQPTRSSDQRAVGCRSSSQHSRPFAAPLPQPQHEGELRHVREKKRRLLHQPQDHNDNNDDSKHPIKTSRQADHMPPPPSSAVHPHEHHQHAQQEMIKKKKKKAEGGRGGGGAGEKIYQLNLDWSIRMQRHPLFRKPSAEPPRRNASSRPSSSSSSSSSPSHRTRISHRGSSPPLPSSRQPPRSHAPHPAPRGTQPSAASIAAAATAALAAFPPPFASLSAFRFPPVPLTPSSSAGNGSRSGGGRGFTLRASAGSSSCCSLLPKEKVESIGHRPTIAKKRLAPSSTSSSFSLVASSSAFRQSPPTSYSAVALAKESHDLVQPPRRQQEQAQEQQPRLRRTAKPLSSSESEQNLFLLAIQGMKQEAQGLLTGSGCPDAARSESGSDFTASRSLESSTCSDEARSAASAGGGGGEARASPGADGDAAPPVRSMDASGGGTAVTLGRRSPRGGEGIEEDGNRQEEHGGLEETKDSGGDCASGGDCCAAQGRAVGASVVSVGRAANKKAAPKTALADHGAWERPPKQGETAPCLCAEEDPVAWKQQRVIE